MNASLFGGTKVDESFVLLDAAKRGQAAQEPHQQHPGRNLDESFVMLAGSASVLQQGHGGHLRASSHGVPMQALDDHFAQLARTFEIASGETAVDQPLCLECATRVREEMDAAVTEMEAECEAYEAALQNLAKEDATPMSEEEFAAEVAAAEEAERAAALRAESAEAALAVARREMDAARQRAAELGELEARYWHDFNDFQLQLRAHVDERDVLLRKIDRTSAHLDRLRRTNVYNDAFHIWHDGPFATISGFRLGRTSAVPVDWDEINAAWGQAILLLHTLAQACKLVFASGQLQPMGSYPRVCDKKGCHDLFGPASKLYCVDFDRAVCLYLACLKEFAEFAGARDAAEAVPGRTPLELPYAIDGDRIGGLTVKLTFNKDSRWTKAMKYMLTNLKWCASWMITRQEGGRALHELPGAMSHPERTLGASLASSILATPKAGVRDEGRGR
ncbi:g6624 [Coccomyxa elongata]